MTRQGRRGAPAATEVGYTMVMTALLLVPLMLFAALAVDVGGVLLHAHEVQRAADAPAWPGWCGCPTTSTRRSSSPTPPARPPRERLQPRGQRRDRGGEPRQRPAPPARGGHHRRQQVPTYFGKIVKDKISITRSAVGRVRAAQSRWAAPRTTWARVRSGKKTSVARPPSSCRHGQRLLHRRGTSRVTRRRRPACSRLRATAPAAAPTPTGSTATTSTSIELPATRTYDTDIAVYDPNYRTSARRPRTTTREATPTRPWGPHGSRSFYQADDTPLDNTNNPLMSSVSGCNGVHPDDRRRPGSFAPERRRHQLHLQPRRGQVRQ